MSELFQTPIQDSTAYKEMVLGQLNAAGSRGLALSSLVVKQQATRSSQERMLKELEKAGAISLQRKGKVTRYWLAEALPAQIAPEEKADEALRRLLPEQRSDRLLTLAKIRDELLKGLGIPDAAIRTCLRVLEQEGLVVKLMEGTKTFYAYVPLLRTLLGEATALAAPVVATASPAPVSAPASLPPVKEPESATTPSRTVRSSEMPLPVTNQRVIEAYRSVRMQRRLPDVEIVRLQEVLHCAPEELKPVVQRLCEQGVFIPGKGDWSFASTATRAAAVLIHGEPHLFVRMRD